MPSTRALAWVAAPLLAAAAGASMGPPSCEAVSPDREVAVVEGDSVDFRALCDDPNNDLVRLEWYMDLELVATDSSPTGASIDSRQTLFFQDLGRHFVDAVGVDSGENTDTVRWTVHVEAATATPSPADPTDDAADPIGGLPVSSRPDPWRERHGETVYVLASAAVALAVVAGLFVRRTG